ncbi:MAG: autotransporter domain-containing protein [Roseitalea sp.]|nr:autotransporter domain-containing protein [Roseitalea sp.]MBO6721097.1 autotransporter domain-containing protein [Roseitalea sp.]
MMRMELRRTRNENRRAHTHGDRGNGRNVRRGVRSTDHAIASHLQKLCAGTACATVLAVLAMPSDSAHAACDNNAPTTGETVTCDAVPPNPDTAGIIGPTSDDVTVNVGPGSGVTNNAGPAIELRSGAEINVDGFIEAGNGTAIALNPAAAPTGTLLDQIVSVATVRAAQVRDVARNAATDGDAFDFTPGQPPATLPAPFIDGLASGSDGNTITITGPFVPGVSGWVLGTIDSRGASATGVNVDAGSFSTTLPTTPGFLVGDGGAGELYVHNGGVVGTMGNDSPAVSAAGNSALGVRVDGGSQIATSGDGSAAISVIADNQNFLFESVGGSSTIPLIETTGTNSPGIVMTGPGRSSAVLTIDGPDAIFRTEGDNSPLFSLRPDGLSSISAAIQESTLTTEGDNSDVLSIQTGNSSDGLIFLERVIARSSGEDAHAVRFDGATAGSTAAAILLSSTFETEGDASTAIFLSGAADNSSATFALADVTASTQGNDAPAFSTVEDGDVLGNGSVQTIDIFDSSFTTMGNNSPGFRSRHLVGGSAETLNFDNLTFATQGDNSGGLVVEGFSGDDSASSISGANTTISTEGANSPGISIGGGFGASSVQASDWLNFDITTTGANSGGFEFKAIGIDASSTVISMDDFNITTYGDGSFGFSIGAVDPASVAPVAVQNNLTSYAMSMVNIAIETHGDNAPGFFVQGLRPGATNSDQTFLGLSTSVTTSGDNSDGYTLGENFGRYVLADDYFSTIVLDNITSTTSGDNSDAFVISRFTNLTNDPARFGQLAPDGSIIRGSVPPDFFDGFSASGLNSRAVQNHGVIDGGADGIVLGDGIKGNFANSGIITAQGLDALVYDIDSAIDDIFELQPGGVVQGRVLAGLGEDTFILGGDGTDSFDVSLLDIDGTNSGEQYLGFDLVEKQDASTWTLTGTNTEIDNFAVNGGLLNVNGALPNGAFTVNGGTLGGIGTVGSFVANNGGTIAPGNSIGTLNVAGDIVFNAGSIYQVELDDQGSSDLIDAAGTATINGGTIAILATPGSFSNPVFTIIDGVNFGGQSYTIIEADGGVTGTFSDITDNVPDVDFVGIYTPTTVQLGLTGRGTESAKWVHPSSLSAGALTSRLFGETLRRRGGLVASGAMAGTGTGETLSLGYLSGSQSANALSAMSARSTFAADVPDAPFAAMPDPRRWAVWGAGLGAVTDVDASGGIPGWDSTTGGLAFGFERRLDQYAAPVIIGAAFGYTVTDVDVGASKADIDSYQFGLYAASSAGALSWSAALSYAFQSYDFTRPVAFGGGAVTALGSADGHAVTGALEAFYDVSGQLGYGAVSFGPLATLDAVYAERDGFTETGAGVLNLTVDGADMTQVITGLGLAGSMTRSLGSTSVTFDGRIAWEHVLGDRSATSMSSIPVAAASFVTNSAPIDRNRLAVGVGAAFDMSDRLSAHIRYDGSYSGSGIDHRGSAGLTIRF